MSFKKYLETLFIEESKPVLTDVKTDYNTTGDVYKNPNKTSIAKIMQQQWENGVRQRSLRGVYDPVKDDLYLFSSKLLHETVLQSLYETGIIFDDAQYIVIITSKRDIIIDAGAADSIKEFKNNSTIKTYYKDFSIIKE